MAPYICLVIIIIIININCYSDHTAIMFSQARKLVYRYEERMPNTCYREEDPD